MQQELRRNKRAARKLSPDDLDDEEDLAGDEDSDPNRTPPTVRPMAGPARMRKRHVAIVLTFFLMVVGPIGALSWYLYTIAVPQYASSVAFNVRSEEAGAPAASLLGFQIDGSVTTDAEILNAFIKSQPLVEEVDAELDIRASYSRPQEDWLFRFNPEGTIEDLVKYWNRMVHVAFEGETGLLQVEVRAFDPAEAKAITEAVLRNSESMINRLTSTAEADATRYARAELERAEDRLRAARQALTLYRSENQIVDPEAVVAAQMGLLTSLQQQLADSLIEFDLLRDVTREGDPRIAQAQRRIEVIESRIGEERAKLGSTGDFGTARPVTEIVGRFEELRVDLEFAESSYLTARTAFDAALEKARRNSRYLATYLPPTLAQSAQYPDRITIIGVSGLFAFLIWSVFALVVYSVRDRR